jgi:hypothetical protein
MRRIITGYQLPITLLLASLACNTLLPPRPLVEWDPSPEALIVQANTGGGMLYEPNAMPEARLWGDGRLVWVIYDGSGARQVLAAMLTSDEVGHVLQGFVDAGFFGWDDHYSPGIVYDAPSTCLNVNLLTRSKSVCETLSGAPRAFGRLYGDLAAGAGQAGSAFVPERGYLSLTDLGPALPAGSAVTAEWPAEALGVALADVAATPGQWLEGEALAFAWGTTNAAPLYPILHEGEHYYQAQLLVPGVTTMQPPEEP